MAGSSPQYVRDERPLTWASLFSPHDLASVFGIVGVATRSDPPGRIDDPCAIATPVFAALSPTSEIVQSSYSADPVACLRYHDIRPRDGMYYLCVWNGLVPGTWPLAVICVRVDVRPFFNDWKVRASLAVCVCVCVWGVIYLFIYCTFHFGHSRLSIDHRRALKPR